MMTMKVLAAMSLIMAKINAILGPMCQNLGIFTVTGKILKAKRILTSKNIFCFCNHWSSFDGFSILATDNNGFKVHK